MKEQYERYERASVTFDLSTHTKLRISGPERESFLNNLCSADITKVVSGKSAHAAFMSRFGKLLADVWVHNEGESYIIVATPNQRAYLNEFLGKVAKFSKVKVKDETDTLGLISVQGKDASDAINPAAAYFNRPRSVLGGYDVFLSKLNVVADGSPDLLETLRIEAGIVEFGKDITSDSLGMEGGLDDAISHSKGCYVGQEVVSRMKNLGGRPPHKVIGLLVKGDDVPKPGTNVMMGANAVGAVTSSCHSLYHKSALLLARIKNVDVEEFIVDSRSAVRVSLPHLQ